MLLLEDLKVHLWYWLFLLNTAGLDHSGFNWVITWASLVAQTIKNMPAMWETWVWCLGQGRSPGEGNGNQLQCSCLENSMNRGAWWATVHGVPKSQTWLRDYAQHSTEHTRMGPWSNVTTVIIRRGRHTGDGREKVKWGHSKKAAVYSQEGRPQEKPHLLTPWSWTGDLE